MPLSDGQHDLIAEYFRGIQRGDIRVEWTRKRRWTLRQVITDSFLVLYIASLFVLLVVVAFGVVRQWWP